MNPHELERNIAGIAIGFFFIFGGLIGMVSIWSCFKFDPYECTVKCPSMAHSIQYRNSCYCESK